MHFFMLIPILYILVTIGALFFFFKILYGIWKSNLERNEILKGIYEELRKGK